MKSVLQTNKECWVCGRTENLHSHHIFGGTANRKISERYGLKIWLCYYHHNGSNEGIHFNKALDIRAKQMAQSYFEANIGNRDLFIREFGKNYL